MSKWCGKNCRNTEAEIEAETAMDGIDDFIEKWTGKEEKDDEKEEAEGPL